MTKVYTKTYVILLNDKRQVIWACGTDEWMNIYKAHPQLKYFKYAYSWGIN